VLILDEADAILYDRSSAQRSWEHTQISEFLQQIQDYDGILIACTNRVEAVDPALRRRFHRHVTFGPIDRDTLPHALAHIFPGLTLSTRDLQRLSRGPALMMSDLAAAAEFIDLEQNEGIENTATGTPVSDIIREIQLQAHTRDRTRDIGF
jgi:SpoVK/Ycf46/Vps4 family AAA+-type ATPase